MPLKTHFLFIFHTIIMASLPLVSALSKSWITCRGIDLNSGPHSAPRANSTRDLDNTSLKEK